MPVRAVSRLAIGVLLILATRLAAAADTAYRWIDPSTGAMVFSDSPPPEGWPVRDLEQIELPQPRVVPAFRSPPEPEQSPERREPAQGSVSVPYRRVWIEYPPHDQSIRENAGNVTVRIGLQPPQLRPGDAVVLYLDGQPMVRAGRLDIRLENLDRGTHKLQAVVVDPSGNVLVRSEPVTFTLHRYSRLFRTAPAPLPAPQPQRSGPPGK